MAIEGPDYSGKSTVAELVTNKFNEHNLSHISLNSSVSGKSSKFAHHFRRPGGSYACDSLRQIVTNLNMDSDTRQVVAFAEEILFRYTIPPFHKLFILDRFNPISGQVYGPDSTKKYWRFLVESDIIPLPDITIFISTPIDVLLKRVNERDDKKDIMDEYFCAKAEKIINSYNELKTDKWFNTYFKHTTVQNDKSIEDLQISVYDIIESELRNKNV